MLLVFLETIYFHSCIFSTFTRRSTKLSSTVVVMCWFQTSSGRVLAWSSKWRRIQSQKCLPSRHKSGKCNYLLITGLNYMYYPLQAHLEMFNWNANQYCNWIRTDDFTWLNKIYHFGAFYWIFFFKNEYAFLKPFSNMGWYLEVFLYWYILFH